MVLVMAGRPPAVVASPGPSENPHGGSGRFNPLYDDKAVASNLPSVVFGACKVFDLTSIFVEDVKAFCFALALSLIGPSLVGDEAAHRGNLPPEIFVVAERLYRVPNFLVVAVGRRSLGVDLDRCLQTGFHDRRRERTQLCARQRSCTDRGNDMEKVNGI